MRTSFTPLAQVADASTLRLALANCALLEDPFCLWLARRLTHLLEYPPVPGKLDLVITRMRWLAADLPTSSRSCGKRLTVGRLRAG